MPGTVGNPGPGMVHYTCPVRRDRGICSQIPYIQTAGPAILIASLKGAEPWMKALMCAAGQRCGRTDKRYLEPLIGYLKDQERNV